jgi:acetyltransferase-like isoleucine patch superfamily enzyme
VKIISVLKENGILYIFKTFIRRKTAIFRGLWIDLLYNENNNNLLVYPNVDIIKDRKSKINIGNKTTLFDNFEIKCVGQKGKYSNLKVGDNCQFKKNACIKIFSGDVKIGNNCALGQGSEIYSEQTKIEIGDWVRIV